MNEFEGGECAGERRASTTRSRAVLVVAVLAAAACGGPFLIIPGGALSGEVAGEVPADWSHLEDGIFELESRPDDPYSVQLNYVVRDGKLYVDPAEGRTWLGHLRADPRVRVRLDGRVYELQAVLVGRPGELEGFDPERFVYQLEARR